MRRSAAPSMRGVSATRPLGGVENASLPTPLDDAVPVMMDAKPARMCEAASDKRAPLRSVPFKTPMRPTNGKSLLSLA